MERIKTEKMTKKKNKVNRYKQSKLRDVYGAYTCSNVYSNVFLGTIDGIQYSRCHLKYSYIDADSVLFFNCTEIL